MKKILSDIIFTWNQPSFHDRHIADVAEGTQALWEAALAGSAIATRQSCVPKIAMPFAPATTSLGCGPQEESERQTKRRVQVFTT